MSNHRDDYNAVEAALIDMLGALPDDIAANRVVPDIVLGRSINMDGTGVIEREPIRVEFRIEDAPPPPDPGPEPDPGPDPDPVPPPPTPNPEPGIPQGATPIYVRNDGSDTNPGTEPGAPVVGWDRAKAIALQIIKGNGIPAFVLGRGSVFGDFGSTLCEADPADPDWRGRELQGTPDTPVVFTAYGEGVDPTFDGTGGQAFYVTPHSGHIKIQRINAAGYGPMMKADSVVGFITFEDCYLHGRSIGWSPTSNNTQFRASGFRWIRSTTRGRVINSNSGHKNGIWIDRIDDAEFIEPVVCDWGWYASGGGSALSQGIYMTGECGPAKLVRGGVFFHNSGAGAQFRAGADLADSFAAWNGARGINVGETLGAKTREAGGIAKVINVVCYQRGGEHGIPGGAAMAFGNLSRLEASGLTLVNYAANQALILNGMHGANNYGGVRVGLNNATISNAIIQGGVRREYNGWGIEEPGPDNRVLIDASCTISGGVDDKPSFSDPANRCLIEPPVDSVLNLPEPVLTPELKASILARETTWADLIDQHKAH